MSGSRIGDITHFYNHINVAVVALVNTIRVGDTIHILGRSTDLRQKVTSLQIEHQDVEKAIPGQEVALKVARRVRPRDKVFKLTGEE